MSHAAKCGGTAANYRIPTGSAGAGACASLREHQLGAKGSRDCGAEWLFRAAGNSSFDGRYHQRRTPAKSPDATVPHEPLRCRSRRRLSEIAKLTDCRTVAAHAYYPALFVSNRGRYSYHCKRFADFLASLDTLIFLRKPRVWLKKMLNRRTWHDGCAWFRLYAT